METNKVIVLVVVVGIIAFALGYLMFGGKETDSGGVLDDGGDAGGGLPPSDSNPPNGDSNTPDNETEGDNISDLFGDSDAINPPELPGLP